MISFDLVLANHPESPYVDDALFWKGCSQIKLRQWDDAIESLTILKQEFPSSPYYKQVDERLEAAEKRKVYYQMLKEKRTEKE